MSIDFTVAAYTAAEAHALAAEGAPSLNLCNGNAAKVLRALGAEPNEWMGQLDPALILERAAGLHRGTELAAVATAAARLGRQVVWS